MLDCRESSCLSHSGCFIIVRKQCKDKYHKAGVEVFDQIFEKSNASKDSQKKFQLFSFTLKSWERGKLIKVFNTSERKARNVEELVLPNPKTRRALASEDVEKFYKRDEISRMMPGMKDFVWVKNDDGTRIYIQKRLLLCNINELYA